MEEEAGVSSATVYWYDDAPWGGCRIPQSWKVYYKDAQGQLATGGNWLEYFTLIGRYGLPRSEGL